MRLAGLIVAPALLLAAAPADDPRLSPSAFRDRLAAAIAAQAHQPITVLDDRTFATKKADGTDVTVSIDNSYRVYLAEPDRLDDLIERFATTLTTISEANGDTDQLVVIVRPVDYVTSLLSAGASPRALLEPRLLAGDLAFYLAVDSPTAIRLAGADDLKRWNIDEAKAWMIGTGNIKARIGPLSVVHFGDANGASGWGAESGLAPSMLADPNVCGPGALDGLNNMIVLVYSRDTLLFAVPEDKRQTASFWRTAKGVIAAGGALSSTPITCHKGRWEAVPAR